MFATEPLFPSVDASGYYYNTKGIRPDWHGSSCPAGAKDYERSRADRVPDAAGLPTEGISVRSRLWSLILRELPFPFREIGTEAVYAITWLDRTAARIWLGFTLSPAWYVVTIMGSTAFVLTSMLFFTIVSSNDPTLGEIAARSRAATTITREHLEAQGDWAAQDKWRIAHMFVDHRPPQSARDLFASLDPSNDLFMPANRYAANAGSRFQAGTVAPARRTPNSAIVRPVLVEPDVRLDLARPKLAEEPKRLVYGQLVREPGHEFQPVRTATHYRSRESRLLVQAEWSFESECANEPPRHPVTRRIIPVPEPRWDELPPVESAVPDHRRPDLAFQMSLLREFLPTVGQFPSHSRVDSVSAHSHFPESLQESWSSNRLAERPSPWTRTGPGHRHQVSSGSYADRGDQRDPAEFDVVPDGFDDEPDIAGTPSFAEVALRLELYAPEQAIAGQSQQSHLVLNNDGSRAISKIAVREPLSGLETVTDVEPAARYNRDQNSIERRIHQLESGKARRLGLIWRPESEGGQVYRAFISVEAAVGATTDVIGPAAREPEFPEVEPERPMPSIAPEPVPIPERPPVPEEKPGLSLNVQNRPRALVDDLVEFQIVVRNTGDAPLHHVRVHAELPQELRHRQGQQVEYVVEELPIGGSQQAVLRVLAESSGHAVCRLVASADEPVEVRSKAIVEVEAKAVVPERPREPLVQAPRRLPPSKPGPIVAAPKRVTAPVPNHNCCCQSQSVGVPFDAWFEP